MHTLFFFMTRNSVNGCKSSKNFQVRALPDDSDGAGLAVRGAVGATESGHPDVGALGHGCTIVSGIPGGVGVIGAEHEVSATIVDLETEIVDIGGWNDLEHAVLVNVAVGDYDIGGPENIVFMISGRLNATNFGG